MAPDVGRWMKIARCTASRSLSDGIGTVAAGVAFFTLLAVFPGIAAVVSLVGLFADPLRVHELLTATPDLLPPGTAQIIARQVKRLSDAASAAENRRALSLTPYIGFTILLWSINKATKALFGALNGIRGVDEERGSSCSPPSPSRSRLAPLCSWSSPWAPWSCFRPRSRCLASEMP